MIFEADYSRMLLKTERCWSLILDCFAWSPLQHEMLWMRIHVFIVFSSSDVVPSKSLLPCSISISIWFLLCDMDGILDSCKRPVNLSQTASAIPTHYPSRSPKCFWEMIVMLSRRLSLGQFFVLPQKCTDKNGHDVPNIIHRIMKNFYWSSYTQMLTQRLSVKEALQSIVATVPPITSHPVFYVHPQSLTNVDTFSKHF